MIRELLKSIVKAQIPKDTKKVALLFSGGIDSLTCGLVAQDLGYEVIAYTFKLSDYRSKDAEAAVEFAEKLGWKINLITIPCSVDNLKRDFLALAQKWKCRRKVEFECSLPWLYLMPEIKEQFVLTGVTADGHFGLTKAAKINHIHPKSKFDSYREKYFTNANPAAMNQMIDVGRAYNKNLIYPYFHSYVRVYFLQFTWEELNVPTQKGTIVRDFPEFEELVKARRHESMQLISGTSKYFELLLSTDLNIKKRKRVQDLCRDYHLMNKGTRLF